MDRKHIIALEISGSQVKGAAATVSPSTIAQLSTSNIEAIVFEDKTNCVKYGRVQNVIDAANHVSDVVRKLENDPALHGGKIVGAYVGLAGRSLGSVSTTAEFTLPSEMEITEDILTRLYKEATKTIPEDKPALKVLPRKFIIDNQVAEKPVGVLGSHLKGEFTVITCSSSNRRNLELIFERQQLHVKDYIITPLALADLLLGQEEKQVGCVLVDMGAQTTTVAVYKERALQYLATLPLGSYNITHDIALGLNTTDERAEMAKLTQGDAMPDSASAANDDKAIINSYVRARIGEIVANITNQITVAGFKPSELTGGMILTGRGAKLTNLSEYIVKQTGMKVRRAAINATVKVEARNIEPADYASLIAIVAQAAKYDDPEGCVEFPQEAKPRPAAPQPQHDPVPFDVYNDSGDDILLDDEEVERRMKLRQQQERQAQERRDRDLQRQADKERADEERRLEKIRKEEEAKAARLLAEERKKNGSSLLAKLKTSITSIFTNEDEDTDADLDSDL